MCIKQQCSWRVTLVGLIWFSVYLVVGRLVFEARLVEDGFNLLLVEIGDTDSFDQSSIHQLLHPLRELTMKYMFYWNFAEGAFTDRDRKSN